MRRQIWLPALLLLTATRGLGGEGTLVLDERVYFRHYYQRDWDVISPGSLKADGEKLLGKRGMARVKRNVQRRLKHLNLDWSKIDWQDRAVVRFVCPNAGIQPAPEAERFMNSIVWPAIQPSWHSSKDSGLGRPSMFCWPLEPNSGRLPWSSSPALPRSLRNRAYAAERPPMLQPHVS